MTPQQKKLYDILKAELDASGVSPSVRELMAKMGLKSTSGIVRLLDCLEDSGHITRRTGKARSIMIAPREMTVDDLFSPALRCDSIAETILAAKHIKSMPWRKGKTVTISKATYQALRKALAKLGAI